MSWIAGLSSSLSVISRRSGEIARGVGVAWLHALIVLTALIATPAGAADFANAYGDADVQAMAVDDFGQSYIAGDFSEPAINLGDLTLTRIGTTTDFFVAKLDATGAVLWARNFGGNLAHAKTVAVDSSGMVYVAGEYLGGMIDPALDGIGSSDAFVLKLDDQGNLLWARSFGGAGAVAVAQAVAVDGSGSVYLGGYQSGSLTQPNLVAIGAYDGFAFKLNAADGNVIWANNFGGSGATVAATGIAVDGGGSVYLGGWFQGNNLTKPTLRKLGEYDAFALKLDANGNAVWAKNFGGPKATTLGKSIAIDATSGSIYLGGDFCCGDLTTPPLARSASGTNYEAFLFKLDGSGNSIWTKAFGGVGASTSIVGVGVDGMGNVYLGGGFCCGSLTVPPLSSIGPWDAFALRLDASGSTVWKRNFGGGNAITSPAAFTVDSVGTVYLGGHFSLGDMTTPPLALVGAQPGFVLAQLSSSLPAAITGSAVGLTSTSATLRGVVSSNGAATTVEFEYGLTTSYGSLVSSTPALLDPAISNTSVSAALSQLACGTLYHYRVKATNTAGTAYGLDATFTTSTCPAALPTVVTGSATGLTPTSATLNGVVSANGASTTVGFDIGTTTGYGTTVFLPNDVTTQNAVVSTAIVGLACNTTYHYRVDGFNSKGPAYGADKTFTTSACSGLLVPIVTNPATVVTATSATLNAVANANGYVATVEFQYGLTTAYDHTIAAAQGPLPADAKNVPVSLAISGLSCNTPYHFRARVTDITGTYDGADLRLVTAPCAGLTVKSLGNGIGTVTSNPEGINCGSTCNQSLATGTNVTLTASNPFFSSAFGWWGGACAGSKTTCTVSVSGATVVTATFMYTGTQGAFDSVQDAYIAYYGRPADPQGRAYWAGRTDASGKGLDPIIGEFGYSPEYTRRYGTMTPEQLVDNLYVQVLARHAEQGGLDYWVGEFKAGRRTLPRIAMDILNGVQNGDVTTVNNKREVANYFSGKVEAGCPYGTEQDGLDVLAIVDGDPATVVEAKAMVDNWCGN